MLLHDVLCYARCAVLFPFFLLLLLTLAPSFTFELNHHLLNTHNHLPNKHKHKHTHRCMLVSPMCPTPFRSCVVSRRSTRTTTACTSQTGRSWWRQSCRIATSQHASCRIRWACACACVCACPSVFGCWLRASFASVVQPTQPAVLSPCFPLAPPLIAHHTSHSHLYNQEDRRPG